MKFRQHEVGSGVLNDVGSDPVGLTFLRPYQDMTEQRRVDRMVGPSSVWSVRGTDR